MSISTIYVVNIFFKYAISQNTMKILPKNIERAEDRMSCLIIILSKAPFQAEQLFTKSDY